MIRKIANDPRDTQNDVKTWLKLHAVRTVCSDIPAAICLGLAAVKALS